MVGVVPVVGGVPVVGRVPVVGGVPVVGRATCGGQGYLWWVGYLWWAGLPVVGGATLSWAGLFYCMLCVLGLLGKSHACLYCEWSPPIYSNKN